MRWAALLLLAGCVDAKLDTGAAPVPPWRRDDDGDAFTADVDCDDADAGVHPGAPERCDGLDQDCDARVDEDASDARAWYPDGDGDGYGDLYTSLRACDPVEGWLETSGDCDDDDPGVHPDATEGCDGDDDDCDGEIDEGDLPDSPTWYRDADGDTHGDPAQPRVSCAEPPGYVADGTDCDDTRDTVHPSAPESCDDVDQDCDGRVDDDPLDGEVAYADADGDGWGDGATAAAFCADDRPAGAVSRDGDCDDARADLHPEADERCDGLDGDCDGEVDEDALDATAWYADADADGYGAGPSTAACAAPPGTSDLGADCDDGDASAYPGADEYCDAVDTDCDGAEDEDDALDALTWYADADADGFGAAGVSAAACEAPAGYLADATDCDDAAAAIHPGAAEYCDAVDTDCDGTRDEDDALDAPTWYADADADGYGDAAEPFAACAVPVGFAEAPTDCDDGDASVSPGLPETCDGRDDDCDGFTDEDDAVDAATWYADADADGYGDVAAVHAACSAPAGHVASATDCDDDNPLAAPGRPEVCSDGADNDCDGTDNGCVRVGDIELLDVYHARVLGGAGGTLVGSALAFAGDVDGDGVGDLMVGVPGYGEAWLFAGVPTGDLTWSDVSAAFVGDPDEGTGGAVSGLGDFDGDGLGDVAVAGTEAGGSVSLVHGPWTTVEVLALADLSVSGVGADDALGSALARVGDLDGDGLDDLVAGAPEADSADADAGAVYIVLGGATGSFSASAADGALYGGNANARLGSAVAGVGDVDGDGLADLLVGAPNDGTAGLLAGAAYLVSGPAATGTLDTGMATASFLGVARADLAGTSVASAGDTDGDGADELLVGAPYSDGGRTDAGATWLVRGPFAGTRSLADAAAVVYGGASGEQAGSAVAGVGDVDADGYGDLAVGARFNDDAGANAGLVYLLHGPGPWSTRLADASTFFAGAAGAHAGSTVVSGLPYESDLSGDAHADFLVGAPYDVSAGFLSAGAAYLVPGRGI